MRDIAPTGVRLPAALREALQREAYINGRSLSAEVLFRLQQSVAQAQDSPASSRRASGTAPVAARAAVDAPSAAGNAPALQDPQRRLLALYARLTPERQLALLTLLGTP